MYQVNMPVYLFYVIVISVIIILVISNRDEKLLEIRKVIHTQLPSQNYELLKYIMMFLDEVRHCIE